MPLNAARLLGVAVIFVTSGAEQIMAGPHAASHGLSVLVAAAAVAVTIAVLVRKAGQMKPALMDGFTLSPESPVWRGELAEADIRLPDTQLT